MDDSQNWPEERDDGAERPCPVASVEHLTGPMRGEVTWLDQAPVDVLLGSDRRLRILESRPGRSSPDLAARIRALGDGFEIEAAGGHPVWVNRRPIGVHRLEHHDVIEFGERGPISRFRLMGTEHPLHLSLDEIVGDTFAYLRASRRPLPGRLRAALIGLAARLTWQTQIGFRIAFAIAVVVLGLLLWRQVQVTDELRAVLEGEARRLDSISAALTRTRDEALRPGDLAALRDELAARVTSGSERLEALERQSTAIARAIGEALPAVAFLQGAWGFRDPGDGRWLRQVIGPGGVPLIGPRGQPLFSLDGDGPVAEAQFTGTGFLIEGTGALFTNRHVARPWEGGPGEAIAAGGLEPAFIRFLAFFPGRPAPVALDVALVSETADLAALILAVPPEGVAGLRLAGTLPEIGSTVVVLGYPTGLRAMLAQAGRAFVETLQAEGETGFWTVAERLAAAGHIAPLASRGIVGQRTGTTLVYDAETTHGGSGGPVLDATGRVVAVNSAILPEFGGSNLGVPAAELALLVEALARRAASQ